MEMYNKLFKYYFCFIITLGEVVSLYLLFYPFLYLAYILCNIKYSIINILLVLIKKIV